MVVQRIGSSGRITVVIDDAHWLDDDTIAVLLEIIARTRDVIRWVIASRAIDRHPAAAAMRDELERAGPICAVSLRRADDRRRRRAHRAARYPSCRPLSVACWRRT